MAAFVFPSEVRQFGSVDPGNWFSVIATNLKGRRVELRLQKIVPRAADLLRESRHEDVCYAIDGEIENPSEFNAILYVFERRSASPFKFQYFCLPAHLQVRHLRNYV